MNRGSRRSTWVMGGVVVGMFAFGYALIPLYSTICRVTGLNGKATTLTTAQNVGQQVVDNSRLVNVQFVTTVNGGRIWKFAPEQSQVQVHPGQLTTVYFTAQNEQDEAVVGQAVPSVAPWSAANHLHKTECFCFNRQPFLPLEQKRMPVRFMVDRDLPQDVGTVTLSYTFFDVTQLADKSAAGAAKPSPNS
jgi:cytochrome c oxidase assembly protein subunit 11